MGAEWVRTGGDRETEFPTNIYDEKPKLVVGKPTAVPDW
jgi:hypothetical protein